MSFKKKTSTTEQYEHLIEDGFKMSDASNSSDDKIMDVDTN